MRIELRVPTLDRALMGVLLRAFAQRYPVSVIGRASGTWIEATIPDTKPALDDALSALVACNVLILRRLAALGVRVPSLYASGVRYVREPVGREWWQTVVDNLDEHEGDCEDLACHRAAELIVGGELGARAETIRTARHTFHAITRRADGTLEDPAAVLGMRPLSARQRARALLEVHQHEAP
jgi:hypothetical protein